MTTESLHTTYYRQSINIMIHTEQKGHLSLSITTFQQLELDTKFQFAKQPKMVPDADGNLVMVAQYLDLRKRLLAERELLPCNQMESGVLSFHRPWLIIN